MVGEPGRARDERVDAEVRAGLREGCIAARNLVRGRRAAEFRLRESDLLNAPG